MATPSTVNGPPVRRATSSAPAAPDEPISPAELAALAEPAEETWRVVKTNPSRTVYVGRWRGQDVYLKHFHVRSPLRRLIRRLRRPDVWREVTYSRYLNDHGVAAPRVLAAGRKGRLSWVLTAAVAPAERADQWHRRQLEAGPEGKRAIRQVSTALAEMVARMHDAGLVHNDLHCGNILLRATDGQREPVLMDLHRVRRRRKLSRRAKAGNLAQLCYDRMPFTTRTERLRFLRRYLAASDIGGSLRAWRMLVEDFTRLHARKQYAKRDRRVLRRGRYFSPIRLSRGWRGHVVLSTKTPVLGLASELIDFTPSDWVKALGRPEALLTAGGQGIKDSPSSQIIRRQLVIGPHRVDVFVKRPRRKYFRRLILDCFRRSRATRAFLLGHKLLNRRIPTALPLAALERRVGPFLLDSVLITQAIDAPDLSHFLDKWLVRPGPSQQLTAAQRRQLTHEVPWRLGRLVQRLHDHELAHRDLKAGNVLVRWSPGEEVKLVLLDLEGLTWRRFPSARRCFKGLMRLNVSLLECPAVNHAGRLRMLMGYLRRPGCGRINFKPYWRVLENWSSRKLRRQIHSRRQKQKALRRPLA